MEGRPKIEVIRVSSTERRNFRPVDGVQLRAAYSHVRIGTFCPGSVDKDHEDSKIGREHDKSNAWRKPKKNLGPVSRLLRRRNRSTSLATKSCDNIYSVNKTGNSDWRMGGQSANDRARQCNSLDWRVGREVDRSWRDSRSAETLTQSPNFPSGGLRTPSAAKSKMASLLRRLSPRLSRAGSKTVGVSPTISISSPSPCPWIRIEYSNDDFELSKRLNSHDDVSYQRELQLSELRKSLAASPCSGASPAEQEQNQLEEKEISIIVPKLKLDPPISLDSKTCKTCNEERGVIVEDSDERRLLEHRADRRRPRGGEAEVAGFQPRTEEEIVVEKSASDRRWSGRGDEGKGGGGGGGPPGTEGPWPKSILATSRGNRRPRPISLAVQPLNYQRLDPESSASNADALDANHEEELANVVGVTANDPTTDKQRPNMTSQESIGNCSLDVDRSASDRSENILGSLSERTLHSLNLSCNSQSPQEDPVRNGPNDTIEKQKEKEEQRRQGPIVKVDRLNGESVENVETEQLTAAKKPSYLGLACSISGYSGITRYDSKLREGFRSRDSSPGSRLVTRETSPADPAFRSSENLGVPRTNLPTKSKSISPLAMDRQNGFSNGAKDSKREAYLESVRSTNNSQGYSEVDRGTSFHPNFADLSPVRASSPIKTTLGPTIIPSSFASSLARESKSYASTPGVSVYSSRSGHNIVSSASSSDTSFILNGSSFDSIMTENKSPNVSSSSEKSFIQQRVERLYGPGALAQGFFFKRGTINFNTSDTNVLNKSTSSSSNNNDSSHDNANTEESLKNLPVLRHLRPEFRAQLPVLGARKATDGTEQIIKPLHRISVSPHRRQIETAGQTTKSNIPRSPRENESIKLSASVTSIPDQQPAAPEVVLPVIETVVAPTVAASISETASIPEADDATRTEKNPIEEKHGHHFMRLLNAERERLLSLAKTAEVELEQSPDLPEEAEGKLRSASGKARLLAKQKMQQFEGLCHKNISQLPGEKFPTTYEDLAGFWDMVMLQVVQVNDIFAQIDKLRISNWQEITPEKKAQNGNATSKRRLLTNPRPKITATTSEASRKAREAREQARRQMIEDRRRAMRNSTNRQKENNDDVTIFAPET